MWDSAQVQGYISEWPAADWRYSVAHSLRQTLYPTAGPHCSTFTEGTHGPHCCHIQRAPMALIAAISRGHPWPSLRQCPEGTHGPHCCHIQRALTSPHSCVIWRALTSSCSCDIRKALTSPHCCRIRRALTSPHSCDIWRALPVSIPLRLQPATHLLSDSTPLVLAVVIPKTCHL